MKLQVILDTNIPHKICILKLGATGQENILLLKYKNKLHSYIRHIAEFMKFREAAQLRQTVAKSKVRQSHPPKNT